MLYQLEDLKKNAGMLLRNRDREKSEMEEGSGHRELAGRNSI